MSTLTLTFSGSYLELVGWIFVLGLYLAIAFAAGWAARSWRGDR